MGSADDRTFKVQFSAEGMAKLSEKVRDKLKEFMGDYTDDTLVDYVIVLLRNGRDKQAARDELSVFLEDDSDSFVSWLWDHLASNLDLYVHHQDYCTDEVAKTRSAVVGQPGENEPHRRDLKLDSVNSDNLSRSRHKREWKDLGRDATEPPPLQSSEVGNICSEDKGNRRATRARSPSPQLPQHRKRSRQDEQQQRKRDTASLPTLDAPRRLLQFAVRDAVGTPRQSGMVKELPSMKRLRSIVSTPTMDLPLVERPRRIESIARVPNAMATVVRAVKEAAEDVRKVRSGVSVFDRLGRDMDISAPREQVKEFRDADVEDRDYVEFNEIQEETCMRNLRVGDYVQGTTNARMVESDTGLNSVSMSDGDGYDDVNGIGHGAVGVSQTGPRAGNGVKNALISQHSAAMNVDEVMPMARNKEQNILASAPNSSRKIANSSVNVNTWKPPNTQESGDVGGMVNQKSVQEIEPEVKYGVQTMTQNNSPVVIQNQSVKPPTEMQKKSQKTVLPAPGSYTAGRPLEDADSRTIFVSNVHFAASKDSLSRHFNKFGDVLKVIIVTDAATGQPKGSAYVEFLRKEAADNALSLDGTSFMSRILKVVKRSSAHHDATPLMTWPRIACGSPYTTSRFPRAPFSRGISGGFRARFHVKPGARSMQWKRGDAQASHAESGGPPSGHSIISQNSRSLTYVRTESKLDGNSGTA